MGGREGRGVSLFGSMYADGSDTPFPSLPPSLPPYLPRQTGTQTAVVEAAVMLEAGWEDAMDEVWVVAVDPEVAK